MNCIDFLILFCLSCVLLPCEGQVIPPSNGTKLIFLPGSTVKIDWSYVGDTSQVQLRKWLFKSSDGSRTGELTSIYLDNTRDPLNTALISRFDIEKPAALILKNVDETYNGNYTFSVQTKSSFVPDLSEVVVDIAAKPNVTFSCSSPITVDEGDDFTCVCRGEDGNPPADVAWFKDGVQIGGTRKEIITLTRNNVNETDSGTYKCEARSHSNTMFVDAKTIELIVKPNSKPNKTNITFKPDPATAVGYPVEIMCKSEGVPDPSFIIMRNGKSVSTEKTYTIPEVKQTDEGPYTCIAVNILGNDSATDNLTVTGKITPTPTISTPATNYAATSSITSNGTANTAANKENDGMTVVVWRIVVSVLSGIIFGILLSYIVWLSHHRWLRNRNPERNPEREQIEADKTYQELDLSKMNKEDNYQSLRVNAASNDAGNDDDSTYTELNKTRDVENNYQSLT